METDNNNTNRTFTAGDIEKYHLGLLSPKERHALEKAALDDPFLADALEGYAVPGVNHAADMASLKTLLAERTGTNVVSMAAGKSSFPWLRAAITVGVLAGASLLAYQFFFNVKDQAPAEMAQTSEAKKDKPEPLTDKTVSVSDSSGNLYAPTYKSADTAITMAPDKLTATGQDTATTGSAETESFANLQMDVANVPNQQLAKPIDDSSVAEFKVTTPATTSAKPPSGIVKAEDKKSTDGYYSNVNDKFAKSRKEGVVNEKDFGKERRADTTRQRVLNSEVLKDNEQRGIAANNNLKKAKQTQQQYYSNTFNGRVTDAGNNGLPFANVMNTRDNVGTYTDVNGRFTLTSPDSVLNVQIRSTGFDNNAVALRSNVADNQIVMEEDKSVAAQTLQGPRRINSEKRRTLVLEGEPEPEDGWENYDSYLSNNVNIPEAFKPKNDMGGGQVEVSFEVNEDGEPVRIRVEKSLCRICDKEAIRLIKEGPRWKRKARKGRTTVTISF